MSNSMTKGKNVKNIVIIMGCIVAVIAGTILGKWYDAKAKELEWPADRMKGYSSDTISDNCIICQEKCLYGNEDNLGLICLNEGSAYHVGINRYDNNGKLIEKKNTSMQMLMAPAKGTGKGVQITTNTDRGYADVDIALGDKKEIDMDIAVEHCCADCLDALKKEYYSVEPYDVVVLNYKTGDIRLLTSDLRSFMSGDYYITCEPRSFKGETEISEMDLFIVYCPERYE